VATQQPGSARLQLPAGCDALRGHELRFIGAYCVEGFFPSGCQEAHTGRMVSSGRVAASVILKDCSGNNTLTITTGFRRISSATFLLSAIIKALPIALTEEYTLGFFGRHRVPILW
jgi:hypothetical protein